MVPLTPDPALLPPLQILQALLLDSLNSPHSRRAYSQSLRRFIAWYQGSASHLPFSRALLQSYRAFLLDRNLSPATINLHLSAIRRLSREAAQNGLLDERHALAMQRVPGLSSATGGAGKWLTKEEAEKLLEAPPADTLRGIRDRAILALLVGCGLRRSELVSTAVSHLQQREDRWVLAGLEGKGRRRRLIPVPLWVYDRVQTWLQAASISEGQVFRALRKNGCCTGQGLTERAIWSVVREHSQTASLSPLAPHDLRRTCAYLCRAAGGELEQIQLLLGHASIQTTERYLGTRQNLQCAVNDGILFPRDR